MKAVCRWACAAVLALTSATALEAQQPAAGQAKDPQTPAAKPADPKPADQKPEQKPDQPQKYEETVVV